MIVYEDAAKDHYCPLKKDQEGYCDGNFCMAWREIGAHTHYYLTTKKISKKAYWDFLEKGESYECARKRRPDAPPGRGWGLETAYPKEYEGGFYIVAVWYRRPEKPERGYCGLAGKPMTGDPAPPSLSQMVGSSFSGWDGEGFWKYYQRKGENAK